MTDTPEQHLLTDQAIARLRKLAEGNGLAPEKIDLLGTDEKTYALEGVLKLIPKCDVQVGRYPGLPQGKNRQIMPDGSAMRAEAQRRQERFLKSGDWIEKAINELKAEPGKGWGFEGAKITMPERTVILAASESCGGCRGQKLITCQQCGGQGLLICLQCRGQRQEACYVCGGTGNNPQHTDQRCIQCNGLRFVACRVCQGRGQVVCSMCHGRRGVACPVCKGAGIITDEVAIVCEVETSFKVNSQGIPSGLRRGLDRLGIINLSKGHADIELLPPKKDEGDVNMPDKSNPDGNEKKAPDPILNYIAKIPYADMRMNFSGKKVIVSVFGKRGALLGVPAFLDEALLTAREKLMQAARGKIPLDEVLDTRVIREALALELGGQNLADLKKTYSVGLSADVAREIMVNLAAALKYYTFRLRSIVAIVAFIISALIIGLYILTPLKTSLSENLPWQASMLIDWALPVFLMILSWLALAISSQKVLQRRFPEMKIILHQKTGKTGYGMLTAILAIFIITLMLAPEKPIWVLHIFKING